MTKNEVIETIRTWIKTTDDEYDIEEQGRVYGLMEALELIKQIEPEQKWIPVKWHTITDEEREREGYPEEWVNYVDCIMPEDEQEILITVKGRNGQRWVEKDTCYIDDGFYLDSGYDWVEDVEAWCELPKPYKSQESEE